MRPPLRFLACADDGCRCGLPHPAFADCPDCLGTGLCMGGDELQPCARCALDHHAGVQARAREQTAIDQRRAREAAEDRVDFEMKRSRWPG